MNKNDLDTENLKHAKEIIKEAQIKILNELSDLGFDSNVIVEIQKAEDFGHDSVTAFQLSKKGKRNAN